MNRSWLAPLTPIYGALLRAKNSAYRREWITAKRLRGPVVSVGNLSVGGAGKTPFTIRLTELLSAQGLAVDVLSRGFGRHSRKAERVDPEGDARQFGDEPLLISQRTGVPVFVASDRFQAGVLAESLPNPQSTAAMPPIHILDDGFQHRKLARNVDVVLLHRSDFSESLLPAGRLREPLSALRRAHFVVLRQQDEDLQSHLAKMGIRAPIWWMRRSLELPPDLNETTERVVAFCGIARPEEFFSSLTAAGVNLELTVAFKDHHRYSRDDLDRLAKVASQGKADAFVTTEKDAVKLDVGARRVLEEVAPLRVARLTVALQDEHSIVGQLLELLVK